MSNTHNLSASSVNLTDLKEKYLDLISSGYSETVALQLTNFPKSTYLRLLTDDLDFAENVENARKLRADFWVSKIAESVDIDFQKDEIPNERLKFDKLQFLAKADNPEKYGNNAKKLDLTVDLGKFKLLPPEEAMQYLKEDPFAIEAEFKELDKDLL